MLDCISETIEQFATRMFLSALEHRGSDMEISESGGTDKRTEREVRHFYYFRKICNLLHYL